MVKEKKKERNRCITNDCSPCLLVYVPHSVSFSYVSMTFFRIISLSVWIVLRRHMQSYEFLHKQKNLLSVKVSLCCKLHYNNIIWQGCNDYEVPVY